MEIRAQKLGQQQRIIAVGLGAAASTGAHAGRIGQAELADVGSDGNIHPQKCA